MTGGFFWKNITQAEMKNLILLRLLVLVALLLAGTVWGDDTVVEIRFENRSFTGTGWREKS